VHDFTRDAIRQALMSARPIASFAAAAAASANPQAAASSTASVFANRSSDPAASTGVPRAVIPTMEEIAIGSGVGSDGGFDVTAAAALRPVEQRFAFESGVALGEPVALPPQPTETQWAANLAAPSVSAPARLPHPDEIADLKPLGQVSASFIVAVNGEGLWLVDQHVAHERVLFEQHLEARRAGKVESQRMLMPLVLELSPRQLVIFERIAEELSANG